MSTLLTLVLLYNGKPTPFVRDTDRGLTISKSCQKADGNFSCRAYDVLDQVSFKRLGALGDEDPGAKACVEQHGQAQFAQNQAGNEYPICRFKDGSMVSLGTLHLFAMENDKKPEQKPKQ